MALGGIDITTLEKLERYSLDEIHAKQDILVYHDVGFQYRIKRNIHEIGSASGMDQESLNVLYASKSIMAIVDARNNLKKIDFEAGNELIKKVCAEVCEQFNIGEQLHQRILTNLLSLSPGGQIENQENAVFKDAHIMDFAGSKGRDRLKHFYEELLLRKVRLGTMSWMELLVGFMESNDLSTEYGLEHVKPGIDKLLQTLKKEKKQIERQRNLVIKKELNVSDQEIKKLKKDLEKVRGRDDRGIQTLFRTTIKNHYTLNEMVDRKANIMITVNSIILSLVIGGVIGDDPEFHVQLIPILILAVTSVTSIFYAILSIRPVKTQGDFSEEDIRNKQGNLLYFGNFHNMHFRDFEWAFLQMLSDRDYLYGSMIRDYYHLAIGLNKKYTYQRHSLNIFLVGFVVAISLRIFLRFSVMF